MYGLHVSESELLCHHHNFRYPVRKQHTQNIENNSTVIIIFALDERVCCGFVFTGIKYEIDYYCGSFFEVVVIICVLTRPPTSSLCLNYRMVNGKVLNLLSTRFASIIPSWPPIHDLYNNTRCVLFTLCVYTLGTLFHSIYHQKSHNFGRFWK